MEELIEFNKENAQRSLYHELAITLIPKVGPVLSKKLIAYCGGAEGVFKENKNSLLKIPGIGIEIAESILKSNIHETVEEELKFIESNDIKVYCFLDDSYPKRLKHCMDGPVILFSKGNIDFNSEKTIAVVGTRKMSSYGKKMTTEFIEGIKEYNPLIISGLAFGVDAQAHKQAVDAGLQTVGVVAHGLDDIYPREHKELVRKMIANGGVATEYFTKTNPDRENFPQRNRIVAGMSDVTVVIEASDKSGSLITAEIALSYQRDVAAFPGRAGEANTAGCNRYIKQNKAALIENAEDLVKLMGWEKNTLKKPVIQKSLFVELTEDENNLVKILQQSGKLAIDDLGYESGYSAGKVSGLLLNLELKGIVQILPGKMIELI